MHQISLRKTIEWQCDKLHSKYETTNLIINPLTRTSVSVQKKTNEKKTSAHHRKTFQLDDCMHFGRYGHVWFQFSSIFSFPSIPVQMDIAFTILSVSAHCFGILWYFQFKTRKQLWLPFWARYGLLLLS